METEVKSLATKAANALTADEAMKYSQAACNVANALRALADARPIGSVSSK